MDYYNIASEEKRTKAMEDMKNYYNGYLFNDESNVRLYNPDMVFHFMGYFQNGEYPRTWSSKKSIGNTSTEKSIEPWETPWTSTPSQKSLKY